MRVRKIQRYALVENIAVSITEVAVVGVAWFWGNAEDVLRNWEGFGAGDSNNAYTATIRAVAMAAIVSLVWVVINQLFQYCE